MVPPQGYQELDRTPLGSGGLQDALLSIIFAVSSMGMINIIGQHNDVRVFIDRSHMVRTVLVLGGVSISTHVGLSICTSMTIKLCDRVLFLMWIRATLNTRIFSRRIELVVGGSELLGFLVGAAALMCWSRLTRSFLVAQPNDITTYCDRAIVCGFAATVAALVLSVREMLHNEVHATRRAEELRVYLEAVVAADSVLDNPFFLATMGFGRETLMDKFLAMPAALEEDPQLRRAMAFLRATGQVLYYDQVPALADRVFIVMKELVHHDLAAIVAGIPSSLEGTEADRWRLHACMDQFVRTGIASKAVLQWLWQRAGILMPESDPELLRQLIALLHQLSVVLEWQATADGKRQWLMPLQLPADRPELLPAWSVESPASEVCRLYDFHGDVPSGLVAALINQCTARLFDDAELHGADLPKL